MFSRQFGAGEVGRVDSFRRAPQGGEVEAQFCWKPEKSFLVPLLSRILVFIHFILNSMEGDFYILLSIYKLAQEPANSGPGRETQQSLVLTSMRDSCGDFCQLVKLSVPQFLYLSVFLKDLLNNETQETLIPRLQLSGSKSYLIDIVLTDIVLSLIKCFVDTTESLFIWLSRSWRRKNLSQNSDLFCPRGDRNELFFCERVSGYIQAGTLPVFER